MNRVKAGGVRALIRPSKSAIFQSDPARDRHQLLAFSDACKKTHIHKKKPTQGYVGLKHNSATDNHAQKHLYEKLNAANNSYQQQQISKYLSMMLTLQKLKNSASNNSSPTG